MDTLKRLLVVGAMVGLMQAVLSFGHSGDERSESAAIVLGLGFVLITSLFAGALCAQVGLPKLTGYLATGIAAGPAALGFLDAHMLDGLKLVDGVAIGLIALTGGSEMSFRAMRPLLRSVATISGIAVLGTTVALALTVYGIRDLLPFLEGLATPAQLAVAGTLAIVVVAQSPAVVIAIRAETGADGPVARTVLGVVVLADLLVIALFAVVSSVATSLIAGTGSAGAVALQVSWELFGSVGVGALIGALLALYMRLVGKAGLDLFVLTVCLVSAEVGRRVHLDPLIAMLSAGMFVENAMQRGALLRSSFEAASLPVYILFFTVAGASIHLDALPQVALPVAVLVAVRSGGLVAGTRAAARLAGAPPAVARWAGVGLLPQAGLAIALSQLFVRTFPSFGAAAGALTLSIVAVNELVAPALLRFAFVQAGEAVEARPSGAPATDGAAPG